MKHEKMTAMCGSALQFSTSGGLEKPNLLGFNQKCKKQLSLHSINLNPSKLRSHRKFNLIPAHCCKDSHDEYMLITWTKQKLCKLRDKYVEQIMGRTSVAQIFKERGEAYFRENESQALRKLSLMPWHVVATGGGAVVRPINWRYMMHGITVFLDVPLDALARRIAAVGTDSRPPLDFDSSDAYTKAFMGLFTLSKKRSDAYANADATVSLPNLAASLGLEDLLNITPAAIATEVLGQIERYLTGDNGMCIRMLS